MATHFDLRKLVPGRDDNAESLETRVIDALRGVYDPEIPVNIYDLGLIYRLDVDADTGRVTIAMTLTAPGCPVAQSFPCTVECAVREVAGVSDAHVELVWEPPWTQERMSEAARLQLGLI
jgi:FeS assembly SUF system protein